MACVQQCCDCGDPLQPSVITKTIKLNIITQKNQKKLLSLNKKYQKHNHQNKHHHNQKKILHNPQIMPQALISQ
jgi:uncharacterized FlgJ-related protein